MGYTTERSIQILISLLKAHHIRKVVASPGTTNAVFVASLQNDPFFEIYSSVDERSSAYMACGLSQESGEPVIITCTEATASRNYLSALTEAYYRKLPILAITGFHNLASIGHLHPQSIDRSTPPKDTVLMSINICAVTNKREEKNANLQINKAILELLHHGGGPVHINLESSSQYDLMVKKLPTERVIRRYSYRDKFPNLPQGRIAIVIGVHKRFTKVLSDVIDTFCEQHNGVVYASHISGYYGKYKVNPSLLNIDFRQSSVMNADLTIHIGEIGAPTINSPICWRISEDGMIRDTFNRLTCLFDVDELTFFERYQSSGKTNLEYYNHCFEAMKKADEALTNIVDSLPFCSTWIAHQTHSKIPSNSIIHFGILNSFRTWSFFSIPPNVEGYCNVGGYGIDGGLSTLVGTSLASPLKTVFGVFGDLAFFYDMNSLGNRHISNNVRILLVNNGKGQEFRNYTHPAYKLGVLADDYIAAAGHYGNKSPLLVRHYAEDLGYLYLTASSKDDYISNLKTFTDPEKTEKPIIFEVFINGDDESESLQILQELSLSPSSALNNKMKAIGRKLLGNKGILAIKKIVNS